MKRSLELRSWTLCRNVCAESERAAAADARYALDMASLALKITTLVRSREPWRSCLQGYAWAFVGNARRVANDLVGADEAFANSKRLWEAGRPDATKILDESRILGLEASLRRDQRRWSEALFLLERAQDAPHSENSKARLLLQKALVLEQMGDYQGAVEITHRVLDLEIEHRLLFGARFNLAVNYWHLERHELAARLLPKVWRSAQELGNELDLIRTAWLEGRVAAGLGRRLEAISILRRVREKFAHLGLGCDMALATLEQAILYLEDGCASDARILAGQVVMILRSQGLHREMLAALRLFCHPGP